MAFGVFNQTVRLSRPVLGEYVGGVWKDYPPMQFNIQSSVQPASSSDLKLLPEGRRLDARYTLYSTQKIQEQDEVLLFGQWYEILHVSVWQNKILPHHMAVAVKKQQEGVT